MDYNENEEETTHNIVNTAKLGTWHGDTRSCEQGQVIYQVLNRPINMNEVDNKAGDSLSLTNQLNKPGDTPSTTPDNARATNDSPPPVRFTFANSQTIRSSLSSSSESSDSSKTTWSQVKASGSPTKTNKDGMGSNPTNNNSPNTSPTKNKNERSAMTSWKDISPSKSSSSSDLDHSNHSNHSNQSGDYPAHRMFRFSNRLKELNDSSSSSDADQGAQKNYANKEVVPANQSEEKCSCSNSKDGSPCKKADSCNCSKNCNSHSQGNQAALNTSTSSLTENGSPKREKVSPDELCDNEYYYEDDFTVQFDTNLRETSVTPIDSDPNTTILDFPNMVTGSYLCFNNGGSSNVSFNNSKASSNLSLNNMRGSNIINNMEAQSHTVQYDSEFSGNSGSHNSTMEMSSSERDMMGSSDMIDFSDGPLFTPTPSHILSTDSLDKGPKQEPNPEGEMSGSNGSGETNLNVDCCPRKEEYFLSFDGSHSKVSGSETDISLSITSHDSCPGHWGHSETSTTSDCQPHPHHHGHDRNIVISGSEGQDESSDSFHMCFNKLSPLHKAHHSARENLAGRVLKKLVPLKETIIESGDTSEEENVKTSPTLTAGSKELPSSLSQHSSPKLMAKPQPEPLNKIKGGNSKKKMQKSENLYLVGIGKPVEILRKASVHSHTLPRMKNLVSWKQVKSFNKGDNSKCVSLPELSTSTSWSNIKCRKLSEVSESFHNKRHSASLLEFYQRMKSQSNPVSPETMNNIEQIFWPNFIAQKGKNADMSDSSSSSAECAHCQCHRNNFAAGLPDSVTKAYTNKRIFDWLKMECSSSSRDSNRPNSLACQTANIYECSNKETIISPQTVTLWCGTKTVGSQFPPVTKDCGMQTLYDSKCFKDLGIIAGVGKKDQALQTSDFEEEEILSILSENFDDFSFLRSNEGIASKDILSCPEKLYVETEPPSRKIHRSKSADEYRHDSKRGLNVKDVQQHRSYQEKQGRSARIGRSRSAGRIGMKSESPMRRMGLSKHYSNQSLPDIAFLSSSITMEKEESKESLFDPMKIDLPVPVTIAPKTELEQFNIYQQKVNGCHKSGQCCEQKSKKTSKGQPELGSSSSGISSSSASSGIDPGFCDCRSRSTESPENDLERLIFFPPHTELSRVTKACCWPKKKSHSAPTCLNECANVKNVNIEKYTNEIHPKVSPSSKGQGQGQARKWSSALNKNVDTESNENLYALEEEQTPVASPEQHCCHRNNCFSNCCQGPEGEGNRHYFSGEQDFTDSDFYRAVGKDKIIVVENECYRGIPMNIDSTSSSGSSVPNSDRKPLKSCLRKKNRGLRSRSMSAADNLNLNFEEMEEKVKNRHSYACDEVYIVSDEHGQLMMYQADDSAEPVMFYLGKDGECHMTEGAKNHQENFGHYANFDIQAADSIHSSDSSTERDGSNKRKSVSFASEVSFQSISPAVSPRKVVTDPKDVCPGCEEKGGAQGNTQEQPSADQESTDAPDGKPEEGAASNPSETVTVETKTPEESGCQDNQGSTSSSDSAPEEFHVAMDTNDNIWSEGVMQEKIGLLACVSQAADALIAHFATSTDTFDKLRLGNSAETPEIGDLVVTRLCSALTLVIGNRLKPHLAGFQMFGRVQVTVWKVVEASVEIVPQTRSLSDLVCQVKQTSYLTTHQQRFDAFIFGLLNLRLLDFWIGYISQKEDQLSRFYDKDAILVHSGSTLKKHYNDIIMSLQPLSILPFQLNLEFIKDKFLTDSKTKSQVMIGSKDGVTGQSANQSNTSCVSEASNESTAPMEVTSVLELTASKALTWLAKATLPKKVSESQDLSQSKSKSSESANQITDSNCTANQISGSFSFHGDETDSRSQNVEKLTTNQKQVYIDARASRVDCDNILSPSESVSLGSSILSNGGKAMNQSLTQSMTSSASSLVSKLLQFGSSLAPKQTTYKKGVTEYSFDKDSGSPPRSLDIESEVKQVNDGKDKVADAVSVEPESQDYIEEVKLREKQTEKRDERNAKRVSFDIVNLFDKLLLPSGKPEAKKPTSRIPVPTNRWSWSFGTTKQTPASPVKVTKSPAKSDSEINKREHFPKKTTQQSEGVKSRRNGINRPGTTSSPKSEKTSKGVPPPKPPRLVPSPDKQGSRRITGSLPAGSTRNMQYDVNKNTATL